jgi:hypothetical protein
MSRRRKLALAGCAAVALVALVVWPRAHGPSYEGRTVEEWFKHYDELKNKGSYDVIRGIPLSERQPVAQSELMLAESAFRRMGTNAVPYLVGRVTQDFTYSKSEVWRMKIRGHLPQMLLGFLPLPLPRGGQAITAANLLSDHVKPPGEMLLPLLEPALQSNWTLKPVAFVAMRGISSGHELARPYLERGLKEPNGLEQRFAIDAIGYFGEHGNWAVSNLLELASSPDFDIHKAAIRTLNRLGTNSWPVRSRLKEMWAVEQDERRRKGIADAIRNIHTPGPGPPPMGKE